MSIKFTVSAPGKIILNGEHSVVYDKPALAGVVGLRTSVTFTETDDDCVKTVLDLFPGIVPVYKLSVLNEFIQQIQLKFNGADLLQQLDADHDAFLALVLPFVRDHTTLDGTSDEQKTVLHKIMSGVVYLLTALKICHAASNGTEAVINRGFVIKFKSQIPIGAGLGSSAAFAVCVSAAFYTYNQILIKRDFVKTFNETASNEEQLYSNNTISSWAFLSERIMHGTPSGLDNTVCTFGDVVKFTKNPKRFVNLALKSTLNIMLVNSGVSRNTLEVVRKVRQLKDDHSKLIDLVMDAMGVLVEDVVEILENEKCASDEENYSKLKRLFSINNNLLRALDVSHPVLEEIFSISESLGFSVKLTGAGAGGFAIILLPPSYSDTDAFHELCSQLSQFETNVTTIGGAGLQISE